MVTLQTWAHEHWKECQPEWYRALITKRRLEAAVQDAVEKMFRELMEPCGASNEISAPMTVDRWRRMKLERKERRTKLEARRAIQHDKPMICIIIGSLPLVEPVGPSAGDLHILKKGAVILAMVILEFVAFAI